MSTKRYLSDWHYDHANCLGFDHRPFTSVEAMNEALIKRWNAVVAPGDITYVLGDMFWCGSQKAVPVLEQLNGQIILVKGNHDRCRDKAFCDHFAKIDEYIEVEDEGRHVVLCHYPIPCFKNQFYGWYHLYGHVHTSFEFNMMEHQKYLMETLYTTAPCHMYNVGSMLPYIGYTPRTLDEILAGYTTWKERNQV